MKDISGLTRGKRPMEQLRIAGVILIVFSARAAVCPAGTAPAAATTSPHAPLVLAHCQRLSPELTVLAALMKEQSQAEDQCLPILVECSGDDPALPVRLIRPLIGPYALAMAAGKEIDDLSESPNVRYAEVGGSICTMQEATRRMDASVESSGQWGDDREPLVGVVDQSICPELFSPERGSQRILAVGQETSGAATPQSAVHGSIMAKVIAETSPHARYALMPGPMDKLHILSAVGDCYRLAQRDHRKCVINISANTTVGPHDGTSIFERILERYVQAGLWIVVSAGNTGDSARHAQFTRDDCRQGRVSLPWSLRADSRGIVEAVVDMWFDTSLPCIVSLVTPGGRIFQEVATGGGAIWPVNGGFVAVANGLSDPPNGQTNVLVIVKCPLGPEDQTGDWSLLVTPQKDQPFTAHAWMNCGAGSEGQFTAHVSQDVTVSPPATCQAVISVGAYCLKQGRKVFLSRGPTRDGRTCPDLTLASPLGTSYAAARVTGLLAESLYRDPNVPADKWELIGRILPDRQKNGADSPATGGPTVGVQRP